MATIQASGLDVLVDDGDLPLISQHWWKVTKSSKWPTVGTEIKKGGKRRYVQLSRMLMAAPDGLVVDHVNGNRLDNRRCNLRICTQAENIRNQKVWESPKSSRFKGVSWISTKKRWHAVIRINHRWINLGYLESEVEAARRYDKAAIEHHGEFAKTNAMMGLF